jgi:signal transduction histidine kinase
MNPAPGLAPSPRRLIGARLGRGGERIPLSRDLLTFVAVAMLALLVTAAGTVWMSERIARERVLDGAEQAAQRLARLSVAPLLAEELADGQQGFEELDELFQARMTDGSLIRAVVWRPSGEVVYISDPALQEVRSTPSEQVLAAVGGETVSDFGDTFDTDGDDPAEALLEVYTPLQANGERLALETYVPHESLAAQASAVRADLLPIAIGALVALQAVQIPIAVSLARRANRRAAERAALIEREVSASDRERRAIADDLHDGPVHELAGVSYALSALKGSLPPERHALADRLVGTVRHAVQALRKLMIDIYPPDLRGPGLGLAIAELLEPVRAEGIEVVLDARPMPEMKADTAAALYRTAKEALANVVHHSKAGHVRITLEETRWRGAPAVSLEVCDDGVGFPDEWTDRRQEGHLGLSFLRDRVVDVGGTVELGNRDEGGAVLTAVVPLQDDA